MVDVWCDGSITGSHWAPKGQQDTLPHLWCGWVARAENGNVIHHKSFDMGEWPDGSANIAEYMAVRSALRWLSDNHRQHPIQIHSDSQIVMSQISGRCKTHHPVLVKWRDHVRKLSSLFPHVTWGWISREKNRVADRLSKALQVKFEGRPLTTEEVEAMCQEADRRSL